MLFKNDNIPDWLKQANNNYMKEQSQDNAVADFFARHNFTKQPEREEAPGFFAGVQSGIAGVLGGQARFGEVNSPLGGETLGKAADYFENMQRENARDKFSDGAELSWDYITDPQGLRYDVGNTVGSGAALGAETAAVAAAVAHSPLAAGAAAVGRALPVVAKLWNSPLGKVVVGNVAQTPLEAISEGGNLVPELRQAGYSEDEIQEIANRAAALNIGGLGLSNLIQSYGAGKVLGLLRSGAGKATASEIAKRGLLGAVGGGISNAGEEGMQSAIGDIAIGRPIDWGEVESSARTGFASGSVLGGIGGAGGSYIQNRRAQNAEQQAEQETAAAEKEAFINAIAGQESGGDYNAVNGRTGAAGKYQIMPENWPAWAEEAGIGADAEMTPENQEIVARFKLGQYYDKYGARDAAIAWYGGEGAIEYSEEAKNRKQGNGNEPSINEYANSVMARMGAGVGRRDLRSMYADENDTAEVTVPEQRVIPARGFDTTIADEQAADSEQSTAYNEDEIARRIAERINENSSLTDEALDAIAGNRGAWTDGVSGVEFNDGSRRARTATVGRSAGTPASVSIATPALNRLRGGRQRTRTQANLNSSRQDYIDELNRRELNARIDQLNVENQQTEPPRANNSRLTALIRRARSGRTGSGSVENALRSNSLQRLTERAMSGDHSAERSFAGLRPDVRAALLGRHTARLEAQNREVEANASRKALRAAEAQQAERQQAQQQEILREAEQYFRESYSDPLQGVRRELRDARANVEKLLEPVLDSLREGAGNGYSLVPGTEEGRMVRMSNNAPWYQEFRRTYGRKPNKGELVQIAREIYSGTNSYGVPGWERTQESEAEFARNREQLAELDEFINTYEQLEERFAAEQKNGGTNNGENALDNENNNQNSEPQESQQSGQTREEGKNAEAEKEINKNEQETAAAETETPAQEQTPATEEKTPQNVKSVDVGATFNINDELNGIEIKFSSKPSEEVRRGLKDARYRWSSAKQLWYAKQTPAAMAFAESIGYAPENVVQSNQENNATMEQKPTQEVEANGHDDNAQGLRGVPENVSEREVPRTEGERETERVREGNVDERGSEVTGHSGRAAGKRPVPGERGLAGESAAQSSTGSDSERTSERGSVRALKPSQKKNAKASEVPGHNFTITDDENIGKGGAKTKYKDNVAAIRLLKQLEAENRLATPEEQKVLARYVGWGGLSPVFSYGRDPAWESEKTEIKELLTDEEYSAARESTLNAHYTSPEVIKGVWKILERLGFKGGKVLEPSMGVGNFFGIMPEKLRSKSSLNGVELDPLTGRIAKQLYQKANVEVTGYEQTKFPDNYFDLVISNVPFGDYKLHDPKYNKYNFNIHNYFFAKSIDQVRPGGIVAFITSTGTMQSGSDSKRLREILKGKADFIGAVRLPDTAFKENAGTEVTTDLIILQKREQGAAPGKNNHAWLDTVDTDLRAKYGGKPLQINEYYRDNPDMLIGELKEDSLYSGGRLALDGRGLDVGKELESRVEKFPKNIYKPRTSERNTNSLEAARKFLAPSEVRKGQFVVMKDGVYFNDNGEMTPLPKAAQARAKDYVQLRDTTKKILDGQINPKITDEALDGWRKDLNKLYDKFVAKYGYLNNAKIKRDLANDPDFGIVAAIEKYTLDKKTKKESAEKADIFTKRTVNPVIKIDKADNPSDALALSLSNTGAVDVDYMAQLTGQKADDIAKSLKGFIYKDPATDSYVTADDYLSGNVREKLEIAELAAKTDSSMRENVEALKKVQPADLRPDEISVGLGTPWIPESDIRAFAREMLNMGSSQTPLDIRFNRAAGTWLVSWNKDWSSHEAKNSTLANQKWGTRRRDFGTLLDDALNQRSPIVRDTDVDGNTTVNADETQAAQTKLKEIKNEFSKWIWKDKDRAERLAAYYNRNYNNMRLREYNGSMLTLPGYSSVAPPLKQHQKDSVWRIIQDGTALLAHTVGAGKTWTMQTAAMELKRLGIVNKSMFVIPNHMLQQFENEFRIIYPNAKLLTISSENLPDVPAPSKKGETAEAKKRRAAKIAERQKILSRIATEDWDGIIISHNMFKRIPMSPEAYNAFYQDQIDTMRNAIIELSSDDDRNSKRLVKELEKKAKSLEEKLKRDMNEENKDIVIPFEQLGIDEIFVDEADLFKNLFFVTKMNRIGGLSNTNSQRSLDMYMKTQYLAKHNNGRGVVFATGTPISNTMAEMFTMLRYLDGKGLKEKDMDFFDNWAAQFAERETVFERSPDGQGYRRVEKFTKFKNMPELVKMFRKVADVKTKDDLDLKIPKLKNNKPTVIEVEPNSALEDYIKRVARERAQDIHERRVDPSVDNMLKLTGDLRKASLDMRLIDPTIPASIAGNKLKAVAENVYKKYIETNDTKGAQLVFCDLSTPKGTSDKVNETDAADTTETAEEGENVTAYAEIKKMLVKQGVPSNEVAFIHDAKTKEQKEELFAKVRDGRVRVLIGSTEKMGAGTNVQKKLVALHHVDAPWRPRDIEQREGRILRQGNENEEVDIFNYVTKDSFDANMWEKLKNKATMIAQALSNNLTGRTLEDADATVLNFAEIESLASGNPLIMEKVSVEADVNNYTSLYGSYLRNRTENESKANALPRVIEYNKTIAENARKDIKSRTSIEGDKFSITLGKKVFTKRADAKEALDAYASNKSSNTTRSIGKIGGFELRLRPMKAGEKYPQNGNMFEVKEDGVVAELIGANTYNCDATLGSIEYAVMHAPDKTLERALRSVENSEKELKAIEAEIAEPFKYEKEFEAAKKRLTEINVELGIDENGAPQYSATTEAAETRSYDEVIAELENALPTAKFETNDSGEIVAEMPNKARFKVNVADKVIVNDREAAAARSAHGLGGDVNIEGMWQRITEADVDGALTVSRTGRKGTAYHEVMHAAMDLALTAKERAALVKHFAKKAQETGKSLEEAIADGYAEWAQARKRGSGTMFGKLFNKMRDMYYQLKAMFTGMENAENVMRRVESGEAWAQRGDRSDGSATRYSASENRTAEQKVANAMSSTERKTTFQRAKDWIAQQKKDFYRDWFDKNNNLQDLVAGLEMTLGRKLTNAENIYRRVRILPSTTAGMANALIEGGKEELKAINSRLKVKLKYPVTMQMVLDNINRKKMDAAHPDYLKKSGFKSWIEAFGAYLTSIRLNEMMLLHDEAYKEMVKEWEANGKKGRKPAYKPYLLPKGITQTDLETVIKNAPPEFRKAANMYYQFNDNVLTILEDAGLIDAETHRILNTKYKYYCPLMRDFSDTAAADSFIGGLTNGGRGIANVSNMLKRISIEGSERKVLNPLESTIKSVAVACNRAERNKVGQLAVQLAAKGGMDGVIQPVEGTTADAKNCIFTVMFDGKKQAYKTIPELYDPIVGYNLPAANFMFGIARNAARLLRAGATSSPSFIFRNVIRDTIFAGVSSKNGFIPFVDTVRGMYALARDPRLKAEFKVAGVTAFKQYSSTETAVKGLDKMAGGKAKRDYDIGDWWNAFIGMFQNWSEFAEAGTRMGEFMKARANGKSIEEAAFDAREVTLDFSRSGVYGERINRYVPFFNAVLQGGDKMIRLFKEDPMGTSLKLAAYIILPSLALWAYNHDEDWYKELDPEIKATCWCLPGGFFRIPKPQEAGILFGSGIEAMLDQAFNNDPEAIKNWAEVFRENITPSIFPTLFLPIWEWDSNYSNFRDAPITPQRLQNLPDELQYTPSTSALARTLGGELKLSPLKIDNTFRGYTGTMGMALVHMFDWFADSKQNMPAKTIKEMPVIRDFTVNQNIQNRSVDDFYTMLHKANEQHAGYGVKGKPSPAVKGVRAAGKLISEAQKDIRELTVNPRLSPEVKRQRIDQKKTYIKNIAKKANARFGRFFED